MENKKDWPLVTQRQLIAEIVRSQKIVKRAIAARWITPLVKGGRGRQSLYLPSEVSNLINRLKTGERPPLLRCEVFAAERRSK